MNSMTTSMTIKQSTKARHLMFRTSIAHSVKRGEVLPKWHRQRKRSIIHRAFLTNLSGARDRTKHQRVPPLPLLIFLSFLLKWPGGEILGIIWNTNYALIVSKKRRSTLCSRKSTCVVIQAEFLVICILIRPDYKHSSKRRHTCFLGLEGFGIWPHGWTPCWNIRFQCKLGLIFISLRPSPKKHVTGDV